jgi:hypothetical protein
MGLNNTEMSATLYRRYLIQPSSLFAKIWDSFDTATEVFKFFNGSLILDRFQYYLAKVFGSL